MSADIMYIFFDLLTWFFLSQFLFANLQSHAFSVSQILQTVASPLLNFFIRIASDVSVGKLSLVSVLHMRSVSLIKPATGTNYAVISTHAGEHDFFLK